MARMTEEEVDQEATRLMANAMRARLQIMRMQGEGLSGSEYAETWPNRDVETDRALCKLAAQTMMSARSGNYLDVAIYMMKLHLRKAPPELLRKAVVGHIMGEVDDDPSNIPIG